MAVCKMFYLANEMKNTIAVVVFVPEVYFGFYVYTLVLWDHWF